MIAGHFDNDCDRDMSEIKDTFTKHSTVWEKTFVIFCWEQRIKEGCLESRDRPSLSGQPLPLLPIQSDKRKNIGTRRQHFNISFCADLF